MVEESDMESGLAALYRLQEVEIRLRRLEEKRRTDELVVGRERLRDALGKYEALAAAADRRLKQQRLEVRQAEEAVAAHDAEIARLEATLYSGEVIQPKELKRLEMRLEALRRSKAKDEETAYARYEAVEQLEAQLNKVRRVVDDLRDRLQQVEAKLSEREADWAFEEETLRAEWDDVRALIDDELYLRYQRLLPSTNYRPVARVSQGVCGGCRTELPETLRRADRRKIVQCDRCGRLLYWP